MPRHPHEWQYASGVLPENRLCQMIAKVSRYVRAKNQRCCMQSPPRSYELSNDDTNNPRVPPHFAHTPAMTFLMVDEDLRDRFFELEKELDRYMDKFPMFIKACPGIYTIGRRYDAEPSDENPLVIVLVIDFRDIPYVTKEIHRKCLRLARKHFKKLVPPFRFCSCNTVLD